VIATITDPLVRKHTMTEKKGRAEVIDVKALLAGDEEFIHSSGGGAWCGRRCRRYWVLEAERPKRSAPPRASGRRHGSAIRQATTL
jgi:hypothetical protein